MEENNKNRIREERKARNLSQEDLGKLLGVSISSISHWEDNTRRPSKSRLIMLAQIFGKPISYFLEEWKNEKNEENEENKKKKEIKRNQKKASYYSLKIIMGFKSNIIIYASDGHGLIYELIPAILFSEKELEKYSKEDIEVKYSVWFNKSDKYLIKQTTEIVEGKFYLIYNDYELKMVDVTNRELIKKLGDFNVIGKVAKIVSKEID